MSTRNMRPKGAISLGGAAIILVALLAALVAAVDTAPSPAQAATVTLGAGKDNTLYSESGALSNGAGNYFFTGVTNNKTSGTRRAVIAFDIASNVPAGSTITSVSLSLYMSRAKNNTAQTTTLRKLLADWGEGTSHAGGEEGGGAPATTGDATWTHRSYPATAWTTAGGDYSSTVSASTSVTNTGQYYTWTSAQMAADVQSWLNSPSTNFGWIIIGNEGSAQTAKRFDSRQSNESNRRPVLSVTYTAPATPTPTGPTPTASPTATASPTPAPTASPTPTPVPFSNPLYFPPATTAANVSISVDEACVQILPGDCTNMWTYGGTYPGLTIRRPTGQTTNVTFTNNLDPSIGGITTHNHGNHSEPESDGQPTDQFQVQPGQSRSYTYEHLEDGGNERGTMQFYHDHRMDQTARNVYMGLAGLYIIDDPADPQTLPSGEFDVPLAVADRTFDSNNQISYTFDPVGVFGDKILINGTYEPYLNVSDRKYRFRILNASNARIYNLVLTTGDQFTQIGTESGLLPAPVTRTEMRMAPAERLDVVVDFAGKLNQTLYLRDTMSGKDLVQFRVTQHVGNDTSTVPSTLRPLPDIGEPTVTRTFNFDRTNNRWTINGQLYDEHRVDAQPVLGTTEKWVFHNATGVVHPVHHHDVDAQCLSRNGDPCFPYETMKETWYLGPGETLEVKMKFSDHAGKYVFHCHIVEHEDDGMMSQFEVVAATPTPAPTPSPSPSPSPTGSPTSTPTPTISPSPTPTETPPPPSPSPTASPTPTPTPTPTPASFADADGDGVSDGDEEACGGHPTDPLLRPERRDGPFAGIDDDGDLEVDEPLAAAASGFDCDGDGYKGTAESGTPLCGNGLNDDGVVFGGPDDGVADDGCPGGPPAEGAHSEAQFNIGLTDQDPCGVNAWPSDFVGGGIPNSTNRVTITDLTSFTAVPRKFNTSPGHADFNGRWDLVVGRGLFTQWINLNDLLALASVTGTGQPPMLGGARAFNGPECPWAP